MTFLTMKQLSYMKNKHEELELIKTWVTEDVRPGRSTEKWLNVLVKRVS